MNRLELDKIRELPVNPNKQPFVEALIQTIQEFDIEQTILSTNVEKHGTITIEFRLPHQRLLFSLEVDPEESGWAFASRGHIPVDGPLQGIGLHAVLSLMWKPTVD